MEVAAGVIGVASLAIQLADSVKKLSDFWKSVEEAPLDIQTIIADLDCLSLVLSEIANEAQQNQPNTTLEKVLNVCNANVKALNSIIHQFEPGFSSTKYRVRKWTAIKSVLKREKIERFSVTLDRLNTILILVLRNIDRLPPIFYGITFYSLADAIPVTTPILDSSCKRSRLQLSESQCNN